MSSALIAKLVSLAVVWIVCIILGGLPYFLLKRCVNRQSFGQKGVLILSMFNAFSGGVFLGTCLLHLMVEGKEEMTEAFEMYHLEDVEYPVFEVLVAAGFYAIVFVDFVAEMCLHKPTDIVLVNRISTSVSESDKDANGEINRGYQPSSDNQPIKEAVKGTQPNTRETTHTNVMYVGDSNSNKIPSNDALHQGTAGKSTNIDNQESHAHGHEFNQLAKTSTVRATLLLIALSFHTIFDGLAIGLQEEEKDVWQVLTAISIHKGLVAFCLGLQLFRAYEERIRTAVVLIFLFAFISPIGVGIGIIVTSAHINTNAQTMASAVLQGLASGTFLYVTFFEILKQAFSQRSGIGKVLVSCVGFAAMALVKLMDSH